MALPSRNVVVLLASVSFIAIGSLLAYFLLREKPIENKIVKIEEAKQREAVEVPAVKFKDVTTEAKIHFQHESGAYGKKFLPETMGPGVCVLDYDRDHWPDLLLVSGCSWPGQPKQPAESCIRLYRNQRDGTFQEVTTQVGLNLHLYAMSAAAADMDNDGYPDLFIAGVGTNRLLYNQANADGTRTFTDITATSGLQAKNPWPQDLNTVGFQQSKTPIDFGSSCTFLDYDQDGKLDLFVCHYVTWAPAIDLSIDATLTGIGRAYLQPQQFEGSQCHLFRNLDGKRFTDVSEEAGILVLEKEGTDAKARQRSVAKSLGVSVCDPDQDGWPDIIVANDTVRNFFFHNVPKAGGGRQYKEKGLEANVAYAEGRARGAMGIDWGEYLPGQKGLLIANFANEPSTFLTVSDSKKPRFTDSALAVGLAGPSRFWLKFGAFFFDYDLDGRLDLLTCNGHLEPEIAKVQEGQQYTQPAQLFWNTGNKRRLFEPVLAAQAGEDLFTPIVGRGAAYLDYDGDGDLDVILMENQGKARLFQNQNSLGNHWIKLDLEGAGTTNRDAFGARIVMEFAGQKVEREVTCARGYLSQSEKTVIVGLGKATKVDRVEVMWPGQAKAEIWQNLNTNKSYRLIQNKATAEEISDTK